MSVMPLKEWRKAFRSRVKKAREDADLTQQQIADALQIDQGKYKQYETRSLMPHQMVPLFCIIVRKDIAWLYGAAESKKSSPPPSPLRKQA